MEKKIYALWENNEKEKKSNIIFFTVVGILFVLMTVFVVLNTFVFMNIVVDGSSMCDTLKSGDLLVANKKKQAEVGDIVIIANQKNYWLIKRVIAIGDEDGTSVKISNGKVYVDGSELDEPYAKGKTNPISNYEWELKEGEVFYLGDNREGSADARGNGPCEMVDVVGVVEDWSINARGFIKAVYFLPMKLTALFGANCTGNVS